MRYAVAFLTLITALPAFAQDAAPKADQPAAPAPEAPKPPVGEWKSTVGINALMNTGNSESFAGGGNGQASYKLEKNKLESTASGAYGKATDPTTNTSSTNTKNWKIQERYDRYILDPLSIFALGQLGQDKIAGIRWRYGGAAGLSHEAYKVDPHFFKYELGFDYTRELRVIPPDLNRYSVRVFLGYKYKLSDWANLGEDFESLFDVQHGKAIRMNSLTALTMKLTTKVAFQFGFNVRFDNAPAPGKKKTDTTTQAGLIINLI